MHWGGGGLVRLIVCHPGDARFSQEHCHPAPEYHSLAILGMGRKGFSPVKGKQKRSRQKSSDHRSSGRLEQKLLLVMAQELGSWHLVVKELDD